MTRKAAPSPLPFPVERTPKERPEHDPDPDTLEGPGGRHEGERKSDKDDTITRRGER